MTYHICFFPFLLSTLYIMVFLCYIYLVNVYWIILVSCVLLLAIFSELMLNSDSLCEFLLYHLYFYGSY